jgi:SPP1 family predicted phage head-tail adaptor
MSIYVGAGPLRTLAELQRKVQVRTAAGGTEVTWVKERDVWCRIKGLSPRLKLEAMAREPQITHEIVVRQELGLDATKRLVVGSRAFMIAGIPEDVEERGRYVRLLVMEGVAT